MQFFTSHGAINRYRSGWWVVGHGLEMKRIQRANSTTRCVMREVRFPVISEHLTGRRTWPIHSASPTNATFRKSCLLAVIYPWLPTGEYANTDRGAVILVESIVFHFYLPRTNNFGIYEERAPVFEPTSLSNYTLKWY